MTYVVFSLPRSRTAWLSRFLTYRDWTCGHEELRHMRSLTEIKAYASKPRHGSAETIAAPGWRLLPALVPDAKAVVVRRPANEVIESLMALPVAFDRVALTTLIMAANRKLDQIEARLPCLSVRYADLSEESACKAVFEHCLPYRHDREHWKRLDRTNIQIEPRSFFSASAQIRSNLNALASVAKTETFRRILSWRH